MWPPAEGLTTPNVERKDSVLTVTASSRIHAPAHLVFAILRHVSEYSHWNTWCPTVTVQSQAPAADGKTSRLHRLDTGILFTLHVIMNSAKPESVTDTQLKVTDISTPEQPSHYVPPSILATDASYTADLDKVYRISWKCEGGFVARGLKAERFHEIIIVSEDECELRTWENQGGFLAHTVKWMYKQTLQDKFALWCDDLKKYSEKQYGEQRREQKILVPEDDQR